MDATKDADFEYLGGDWRQKTDVPRRAPSNGSAKITFPAIAIDDYFQFTCPKCRAKTRFFDVRPNGTQKCINCFTVHNIEMPNDGVECREAT